MTSSWWLKRSRNRPYLSALALHGAVDVLVLTVCRIYSPWNSRCVDMWHLLQSIWWISQECAAHYHILAIKTCKKKREFNLLLRHTPNGIVFLFLCPSKKHSLINCSKSRHCSTVTDKLCFQSINNLQLCIVRYLYSIIQKLVLSCSSDSEVSGW